MILGILPRVQTMKLTVKSNNQLYKVTLNYNWFCEMLVLKSHMDCYRNNLVNITLCTFLLEGVSHPRFEAFVSGPCGVPGDGSQRDQCW
jgi:hypothetical protein